MSPGLTLLGLDLRGRRVVAVGGGPVSARRVLDLAEDGAQVSVVAPELCPDLAAAVARRQVGWVPRPYAGPGDLAGAWLVHTATGQDRVDDRVAHDAAGSRIFCVRAGAPARGTARVPARGRVATQDGPLQVAVHAGGDPRRSVTARDAVLTHLGSGSVDLRARRPRRTGWVALVGAGPGDEQLVTARASALLAQADVVVTDRLVPRGLLARLPADVRVVDVGKTSGSHPVPQHEINQILVEEARAGRAVVRLKGGDPYVLGRGGEERLACEAAGVEVEVVPGISSAVAVPAAAGIPVTHRGLARGYTVVTGHDELPALPTGGDHTLVVLMGVATLRRTAALLVEHGRSPAMPVAVVESGCTPQQRVTVGTLADIADRAEAVGVASPAVVVVGDVVRLSHARTGAGTMPAGVLDLGGEVALGVRPSLRVGAVA
ncbi:uroporphyrinogen-III C-methyltransferase [Ornithinimicrobium kibberense]|uniref:uroporphyrinogen-III C-methyltransferase n=1 Tax=Ornithinimicrobium kibberense TaxID=282060 RepID=A0ABV5V614_9MICO|nr:uroporphyrinogen-III C-methyltransferase [Ornithinimicrobium kibberense]